MISDEMAYRQYLDGKEESADILVERYGDALTYYINGYIHDIHESEDLMIEAFAQIFAKERPIDGKGSFRAYLYKTARNLTIRHRQKHKLWFLCLDEVDFELPGEELVDAKLLQSEREQHLYEGMASMLGNYEALGYICMGILAFALGVCVTILLYRLRKAEEHRKKAEEYKQSQQVRENRLKKE